MKRYGIFIAAVAVAALTLSTGFAQASDYGAAKSSAEKMMAQAGGTEAPSSATGGIKEMEGNKCPVLGRPIDKRYSYVYQGTRYYFCCPSCIEKFKAEPEKYIKKKSDQQVHDL
jgi:YHS domain-containing protein